MNNTSLTTPADIIYALLQKYDYEKNATESFGDASAAFGLLTEKGIAAYLRGDMRKHLRKRIIEYKEQFAKAQSFLAEKTLAENERLHLSDATQTIQSAIAKYKIG